MQKTPQRKGSGNTSCALRALTPFFVSRSDLELLRQLGPTSTSHLTSRPQRQCSATYPSSHLGDPGRHCGLGQPTRGQGSGVSGTTAAQSSSPTPDLRFSAPSHTHHLSQGSPAVPVSHPKDESVDQENAFETSNDWFSLQPPRWGRHDYPETLRLCTERSARACQAREFPSFPGNCRKLTSFCY